MLQLQVEVKEEGGLEVLMLNIVKSKVVKRGSTKAVKRREKKGAGGGVREDWEVWAKCSRHHHYHHQQQQGWHPL